MWIRTQNKQRIINSDQIIDIFVARTAPVLYANTTDDGDYVTLGEYKDKDTCLEVLSGLVTLIGTKHPSCKLPLGGDVDEWKKAVAELNSLYVVNNFKR